MALQDVNVSVTVPNVDGWLNTLNDYASEAIDHAASVANSLNGFIPPNPPVDIDFLKVDTNIVPVKVIKPKAPTVSLGSRNLPSTPILSNIDVTIGNAPSFNEADPSVNLPSPPSPLDIFLPVKNFTVNTDVDFPITPNLVLPTIPTLVDLNIPTPQDIAIPLFDQPFPTSNSLVIPGVTFGFSETPYQSDLLNKVKLTLLNRLNGGTGLSPIVEEALWNRGRDREARASLLAERTLLDERASAGWDRPQGSLLSSLDGIIQETQAKIIELNREILIKQADLEQTNLQNSIQQTISLEGVLISQYNETVKRAFEVAKYTQDVAIEIFKLAVNKYNSELEAYKAFATAYSARVQAELSKVEIFKAQIDAERLKGDINEQNIKIYVASLEGIKSNVEIYKTLIGAVSEKLKAEALKVEVYKSEVEAYSEGVKAKATEYGAYSEQIKGELAKVEIFDSKVKAFTGRMQAYAAESDVKIKKAEIDSSLNELKIKQFSALVDAFIKQVQADQLIYQSAVDIYRGETQMYLADVGASNAAAELSLKEADNIILQNKYAADVGINSAQVSLEGLKAAYLAMLEGRKAAGSIFAQIGSSALSAINVSASLSGQAQIQASESHNYNTSL
jgi:hypothetical protein